MGNSFVVKDEKTIVQVFGACPLNRILVEDKGGSSLMFGVLNGWVWLLLGQS